MRLVSDADHGRIPESALRTCGINRLAAEVAPEGAPEIDVASLAVVKAQYSASLQGETMLQYRQAQRADRSEMDSWRVRKSGFRCMPMSQEWRDLGVRMRHRTIRVIEVLQILVFDAVVVGFGGLVIWIADRLPGSENRFFDAAKIVSASAFLLIYIVWVGFDLKEFFEQSYTSRTGRT